MKIKVPFIDVKRFESGFQERVNAKFASMLSKASFIGGEEVSSLEAKLQAYLGVKFAVSCANGTDALQLALRALGVGPGDKVLVPNMTFWATFEAVVNVGASPVTIDSELSDGGVSMAAMEEAIEVCRPKAAIVAHLYGWGSAQLQEIRSLCQCRGVYLVEDGAQSFGVSFMDQPIYKDALISTTSFYPAKVLGAAGDGGAVFTDDAKLAESVRRLSNHGRTSHYGYGAVGWNSRLDALQAAYLNESLEHLDQRLASRRRSAELYKQQLHLMDVELILPPQNYLENGYCNVCLVRNGQTKAKLESDLRAAEIGFGNIYPGAMSRQPGAERHLDGHFGGSNSEVLCSSVINLPLFPYMTDEELDYILKTVKKSLEQYHGE